MLERHAAAAGDHRPGVEFGAHEVDAAAVQLRAIGQRAGGRKAGIAAADHNDVGSCGQRRSLDGLRPKRLPPIGLFLETGREDGRAHRTPPFFEDINSRGL